MDVDPSVVRPSRSRRGSTPWTEVLAMTSMEVDNSADADKAIEDDGAVFDPELPRDMSR